jgi:DNA repair exonuclease SbcCD ATPase subunit
MQEIVPRAKALFVLEQRISKDVLALQERREKAHQTAITYRKAQVILQQAADNVQKGIRDALTVLCTTALNDVFPDKQLSFVVEFVPQKHTTAVEMYIEEDGIRYDPLESRGHGIADLLTFALRVSIMALQPTMRKVLIMDEPFTRISEEHRERAIEFVKEVSEKAGIQIILVTHIPELAEKADKVYKVTMVDGVSKAIDV